MDVSLSLVNKKIKIKTKQVASVVSEEPLSRHSIHNSPPLREQDLLTDHHQQHIPSLSPDATRKHRNMDTEYKLTQNYFGTKQQILIYQ